MLQIDGRGSEENGSRISNSLSPQQEGRGIRDRRSYVIERTRPFIASWVIICLAYAVGGCVAPDSPGPASTIEEAAGSVYDAGIQPLRPAQCGLCHTRLYNLIRTKGGKHRIECRQCHVRFHVFRTGRAQYEEVFPACDTCHYDVHGPDLTPCLGCHQEPHSPMDIPADRALERGCPKCHEKAAKEMNAYQTEHTDLYCHSCHHTKHRYVPTCFECHEAHTEGMTQAECVGCHPPHKALEVVYPKETPQEACGICHRNAFDMLRQAGTKHASLGCARCHPQHRLVMQCNKCHTEPHSAAMSQQFRVCGRCHGTAHSTLLMNTGNLEEPREGGANTSEAPPQTDKLIE